jgi:hypothetical protein
MIIENLIKTEFDFESKMYSFVFVYGNGSPDGALDLSYAWI